MKAVLCNMGDNTFEEHNNFHFNFWLDHYHFLDFQ